MEKQNTIDLVDYDSHLCSKQLNNKPFCKQNNSGAIEILLFSPLSTSLHEASLSRLNFSTRSLLCENSEMGYWHSVLMRRCYPSSGEFEIKLLDQLLEDMCSDCM